MRKIAKTRNHSQIKQIILYDCDRGVYLFPCTSLEDGFAIGDEWYETLEIAEETCSKEYGITENDWNIIPDPPEGCQQDWIAPVRVISRNTENPHWVRLKKQVNGRWMEIELENGKWVDKNNL